MVSWTLGRVIIKLLVLLQWNFGKVGMSFKASVSMPCWMILFSNTTVVRWSGQWKFQADRLLTMASEGWPFFVVIWKTVLHVELYSISWSYWLVSKALSVVLWQNYWCPHLMNLQDKVLWQRFKQMLEEKISFTGKVVEAIPVGCRVEVFGKSGFIPFSHLPYVSALFDAPRFRIASDGYVHRFATFLHSGIWQFCYLQWIHSSHNAMFWPMCFGC